MDKQLFDDAIGEVPPSTVDVDAAIRRGRRAALVRRVANPAVAAGLVVLLLVGVVAYTMTGDDGVDPIGTPPTGRHQPPATSVQPPSSMVTSTPARPAVCDDQIRVEETQGAIDRLDAAIGPLVAAHSQPLQLFQSVGGFVDGVQHGPLEFFQISAGSSKQVPLCAGDYLVATAVARGTDGGDGSLTVTLAPAQHERAGAGQGCELQETNPTLKECQELTPGPGISATTSTYLFGTGVTQYQVDVVKPDGTALTIEAENAATSSKVANGPTAPLPPLTKDQLLQLALEPQLVLFPNA